MSRKRGYNMSTKKTFSEIDRAYLKALRPELQKAIKAGEPDRAASFAKAIARLIRKQKLSTQTDLVTNGDFDVSAAEALKALVAASSTFVDVQTGRATNGYSAVEAAEALKALVVASSTFVDVINTVRHLDTTPEPSAHWDNGPTFPIYDEPTH